MISALRSSAATEQRVHEASGWRLASAKYSCRRSERNLWARSSIVIQGPRGRVAKRAPLHLDHLMHRHLHEARDFAWSCKRTGPQRRRTDRSTKTLHSRVLFSAPVASGRMRSSADCITATCESEFSVHTTVRPVQVHDYLLIFDSFIFCERCPTCP